MGNMIFTKIWISPIWPQGWCWGWLIRSTLKCSNVGAYKIILYVEYIQDIFGLDWRDSRKIKTFVQIFGLSLRQVEAFFDSFLKWLCYNFIFGE